MPGEALTNDTRVTSRNPYIDIAKFVMALLVVAIHVPPADGEPGFIIIDIIARIADPMFFIITSYFFFLKIKKHGYKWSIFLSYIKRIALLYIAALFIYSPMILSECRQLCNGRREAVLWLAKRILFQGPYGALWFLTALFLAITLTFVSAKYLGCKITIILSFLFYLPAILCMEYGAIFTDFVLIQYFTSFIIKVFGWYANGLTYGFFFCAIGMAFAFEFKKGSLKKDLIFLMLSFAALFIEAYLVRNYKLGYVYWALFCLIPVCVFGMRVLIELSNLPYAPAFASKTKLLQEMSVLIFIFHILFRDLMSNIPVFSFMWWSYPFVRYSLVVVFTVIFSLLIIWLSHFDKLKFLRYFY